MSCILKSFSNSLIFTRTKLFQQFLQPTSHVQCFCDIRTSGGKVNKNENSTVASLEYYWSQRFEKENITEPIESIQHIIAHVLGTSKIADLIDMKEKQLNTEQIEKLELLCECRLSRMPVQYIIGEWDFRDIKLKLVPPIFIPRPETEILVDLLLKNIIDSKRDICRVLEIGCGSGAICLSVLHSNKKVKVVAIDMNSQACDLTIENAKLLDLQNRLVVLNSELKDDGVITLLKENFSPQTVNFTNEKFDFIVSNPPYVPTKEIFKLQPEIRLYEDILALDGGEDGCKMFKPILKYASEALEIGGCLILEVDPKHPQRIEFLTEKFYKNKLKLKHVHKDFCNKERIVEITREG